MAEFQGCVWGGGGDSTVHNTLLLAYWPLCKLAVYSYYNTLGPKTTVKRRKISDPQAQVRIMHEHDIPGVLYLHTTQISHLLLYPSL